MDFKEDVSVLLDHTKQWDKTRRQVRDLSARESDVIHINCEGQPYQTTRRVLTKFKDSGLAKMFEGIDVMTNSPSNAVFIEYDLTAFKKVIAKLKAYPEPMKVHNPDLIEEMNAIERNFGIDFDKGVQNCFNCPQVLDILKENPEKKVRDMDQAIITKWKSLKPFSIDDIVKGGFKIDLNPALAYGEAIDEENGFYYFG